MADGRRPLKLVGAAAFLLLAVRRFVPAIPLAMLPHQAADVPDATADPVQELLHDAEPILRPGGLPVRLVPRATFDASGEVVSAERYRFDGGAFVCPYDVALRWGVLLEEPHRSRVTYYQNGRFCLWKTDEMSFDRKLITSHMANIHVIPGSSVVRRALAHVRRGHMVRLQGTLVDIEGVDRKEGFRWGTSLSRDDTDKGACETLLLESLTVGSKEYG